MVARAVLTLVSNPRLHTDEQLRGANGAPPLLAGEANVGLAYPSKDT